MLWVDFFSVNIFVFGNKHSKRLICIKVYRNFVFVKVILSDLRFIFFNIFPI